MPGLAGARAAQVGLGSPEQRAALSHRVPFCHVRSPHNRHVCQSALSPFLRCARSSEQNGGAGPLLSVAAEAGKERRRARRALLGSAWKMAPRLYVGAFLITSRLQEQRLAVRCFRERNLWQTQNCGNGFCMGDVSPVTPLASGV